MVVKAIKNDYTNFLVNNKAFFTQNISINGRIGRWSIIDACVVGVTSKSIGVSFEMTYAFLEHNTYGDETVGLLVKLNLITGEWEEVAESYDGLAQALYDEDIIDKMPDWD